MLALSRDRQPVRPVGRHLLLLRDRIGHHQVGRLRRIVLPKVAYRELIAELHRDQVGSHRPDVRRRRGNGGLAGDLVLVEQPTEIIERFNRLRAVDHHLSVGSEHIATVLEEEPHVLLPDGPRVEPADDELVAVAPGGLHGYLLEVVPRRRRPRDLGLLQHVLAVHQRLRRTEQRYPVRLALIADRAPGRIVKIVALTPAGDVGVDVERHALGGQRRHVLGASLVDIRQNASRMRRDELLGEHAPIEVLDVDRDVRVGGLERWHQLVIEELLRALLPVGEPHLERDRPACRPRAGDDGRREHTCEPDTRSA